MESKFAPGFYSQEKEFSLRDIEVKGDIPDWLSGALLRTGPALFSLEHQQYNHWYDGLAMLYKFAFHDGKVDFACKYLQSDAYLKARETGQVCFKEWATDPCQTIFEQFKAFVVEPELTDNGNINIIQYGDELLATSETPLPLCFDEDSLETREHAHYTDSLEGQIEPSHPHYDREGRVYSYLLKYGLFSKYQVYRMDPDTMEREVIASIRVRTPAYMHSFAMTENYAVLVEFPFIVRPIEMRFTTKPLIENFKWKPDRGTRYQVIDLKSGNVTTYHGTAVFAFHHVNAYEENGSLLVDMICYEDASVVEELYLNKLRSNDPTHADGKLHRARIPVGGTGDVQLRELCPQKIELPRINYTQYNGRPYKYVYGAGTTQEGDWLDNITRINVETGESMTWFEGHCYPSEPVFALKPGAEKEDDGVLLSLVLDSDAKNSFLLILDAHDLREIGRAYVKEVLPFSFHGNFFSEHQRGSLPGDSPE